MYADIWHGYVFPYCRAYAPVLRLVCRDWSEFTNHQTKGSLVRIAHEGHFPLVQWVHGTANRPLSSWNQYALLLVLIACVEAGHIEHVRTCISWICVDSACFDTDTISRLACASGWSGSEDVVREIDAWIMQQQNHIIRGSAASTEEFRKRVWAREHGGPLISGATRGHAHLLPVCAQLDGASYIHFAMAFNIAKERHHENFVALCSQYMTHME